MSLFQKSVLNKYFKELSIPQIQESYLDFQSIFNNSVRQQNILNAKEEQYQEGFLRELFVNILGYTLYPDGNHNLITEQKNETNSKKADGAILNGLNIIAVIELKSTKTVDLASIESQAFGYKNNQQECKYVITSNFKKLRFYIDNAVEFLEFDLFNLSFEDFKLLWVCLSANYLLKNIPAQIREASNHQEEIVTKQLYADYAKFRNELFNNIYTKNTNYDKLFLFKKTQKLLDRFLFLFFAEDRGLVAPNWTRKILQDWTDLKDKYDNYIPLYTRFRKNFDYLNTGYHGKDGEIFAYNGGLFVPDDVLDNLIIDDDLLFKGSLKLSNYDFESEVDVNILGHIFEHSLNEIDEIQASLNEAKVEKVTKRKKDGVFYTPKYITKYIVENTIGTLCIAQKEKLEIITEDYEFIDANAKGKDKAKRETLNQKITDYRAWLLELKIVDPACGSGAFLNQALEFLIAEHSKLDELKARLLGGSIVLSDVETSILENNLYGVDINEEAVEIAKLSLWLRTAKKGRKLNSLNNNLKCGNSLIDDVKVAGDKAFNWNNEFKEVFDKGGFDVVIGNPPYVRQELIKEFSEFISRNYKSYSGKADLFVYFFEKGLNILKRSRKLGFISSGKFLEANYGKPLLELLVNKTIIKQVIEFNDLEVFEGISAYPTIIIYDNELPNLDYQIEHISLKNISIDKLKSIVDNLSFNKVSKNSFITNDYKFFDSRLSYLLEKVNKDSISLKDLRLMPLVGIKTGYNEGFVVNRNDSDNIKPYLFGRNIKRYSKPKADTNIIFPYKINLKEYTLKSIQELEDVRDLLEAKREKLSTRAIIKEGILTGNKCWYEYQQINKLTLIEQEYIIYPNVSLGNNFTFSSSQVIDMTGFIIKSNSKSLLAILNSKLIKFLMELYAISRRGGYLEYKNQYIEKLPIRKFEDESKINELVTKIFNINEVFEVFVKQFLNFLKAKINIIEVNRNLSNWINLTSQDFFKEIEKQKIKLSLSEQSEWLQYFEEQKSKALAIKTQIVQTDKEIDQMVYELYELTDEEIKIVEG